LASTRSARETRKKMSRDPFEDLSYLSLPYLFGLALMVLGVLGPLAVTWRRQLQNRQARGIASRSRPS